MAANLEYYKEQAVKILYQKNKLTEILAQIEEKTQVKREYIGLGGVVLLSLYLVFGYGAQLICNCIGFIYPAYCSIKALESPRKEDDTKWLTYWVVFALFSVCEFFSDLLLSWFPFYWLAKCMFLVWCFLPMSWNGSDVIYNRIIRPAFIKHQKEIDTVMGKVADKVNELADTATKVAADAVKSD
ncbi:receptor expression-enhancing protein 5-like isoform X3 [Macrobrachium rosenbergii]|uniref:receptor expression-enhancing protein 5-like isoform X3 n=1 Tax=Macrobrachium rosenbergii TaxID=79674 RepID=UPI0034D6AE08